MSWFAYKTFPSPRKTVAPIHPVKLYGEHERVETPAVSILLNPLGLCNRLLNGGDVRTRDTVDETWEREGCRMRQRMC